MAATLGERIQARLGTSTLPDLARRAGVRLPTLLNIVQGKTPNPGVATLAPIARALGMTLDQLYYGDDPPDSPIDLFWRQVSLNGSAAMAALLAAYGSGNDAAREAAAVKEATERILRASGRESAAALPGPEIDPADEAPPEYPHNPGHPDNTPDTRARRAR